MQPRWFWGGFLIASAGVLITNQLGLFTTHISLITLLLTLILAGFFIKGLRYLDFFSIIMSLTFLIILYIKQLGLTMLTPWTLIVAGLLLSFGLNMLFPRRWQNWSHHTTHHHHHATAGTAHDTLADDHVNIDISMASAVRYLHSQNLTTVTINVSMGNAKVYFDDVHLHDNQVQIKVDVSLGNAELYVPQNWQVKSDLDVSLARFDDSKPLNDTVGPVAYITGGVALGNVSVIYI